MKKVFIDGKEGTTGLRIYDRLSQCENVELLTLPEEKRKDTESRRAMLNGCDAAFLCLPDAAAIEAVGLVENPDTVIIDTSTAHRTKDGWAYGFPELGKDYENAVISSKRIAVPGCHASGFISLIHPLVKAGILDKSAKLSCFSITGFSGGGKKMIEQYNTSSDLESPRQYGLTQSHKHLPEMAKHALLDTAPVFSPIVSRYYSGMEVTVPLFVSDINGTAGDIRRVYAESYCGKTVTYRQAIDENGFIGADGLSGFDNMELTVCGNDERILLVARYDNLGKGASGAAIECLNLVIGDDICKNLNIKE